MVISCSHNSQVTTQIKNKWPLFLPEEPTAQELTAWLEPYLQQCFSPPDFLGCRVGVNRRLMENVMFQETGAVKAVTSEGNAGGSVRFKAGWVEFQSFCQYIQSPLGFSPSKKVRLNAVDENNIVIFKWFCSDHLTNMTNGFTKHFKLRIPWRRGSDRSPGVRERRGRHTPFAGEEVFQVHVHQHKEGAVCGASMLSLKLVLKTERLSVLPVRDQAHT